jgi:hypothetical protein
VALHRRTGDRALGQPNQECSTRTDIRFGLRGSKSVKPANNWWFDFEANEGGGYVALWKLARRGQPLPHQNGGAKPWNNVDVAYDYLDANGVLVFQVIRTVTGSPRFLQRRPDPETPGRWILKLQGVERVPYHLPELLAAAPGSVIFIAEGEKDVDRLRHHALLATCNPGGAAEHKNTDKPYRGKWLAEYSEHLRGHHVRIVPDNDGPGEAHALDIARKLHGIAASVRVVRLPDLREKGDISDWLNAGHTIEELDRLADEAEDYRPPELIEEPDRLADEAQTRPPELKRDTRPLIRITQGEYVSVAATLEAMALAAKLSIYYRSGIGQLCRPVHEQRKRHDDRIVTVAILRPHNAASLRRALYPIVRFERFDARANKWVLRGAHGYPRYHPRRSRQTDFSHHSRYGGAGMGGGLTPKPDRMRICARAAGRTAGRDSSAAIRRRDRRHWQKVTGVRFGLPKKDCPIASEVSRKSAGLPRWNRGKVQGL